MKSGTVVERSRDDDVAAMRLILAFSQFMQSVEVSFYQGFFFLAAPGLHLLFAVKCRVNTVIFFIINQFNRQMLFGEIGTFALLVLGKPALQVFSAASIVLTIGTSENVHISFHNYGSYGHFGFA